METLSVSCATYIIYSPRGSKPPRPARNGTGTSNGGSYPEARNTNNKRVQILAVAVSSLRNGMCSASVHLARLNYEHCLLHGDKWRRPTTPTPTPTPTLTLTHTHGYILSSPSSLSPAHRRSRHTVSIYTAAAAVGRVTAASAASSVRRRTHSPVVSPPTSHASPGHGHAHVRGGAPGISPVWGIGAEGVP